jgi:hypothetical protein
MVIGSVSSAYNQVKRHTERIKQIRQKHEFFTEIKWSNVSTFKKQFYIDLIDYFFDTDLMYRAIIVDKNSVSTEGDGNDFDTFYYKMFFQMLKYNKRTEYTYNVFLDIKDTLSAHKVNKLKDILNKTPGTYRNVQNIRSHESQLLQISDLITGAIAYNLNHDGKKTPAKEQVIEKIQKHSKQNLSGSSEFGVDKLNLFFIELR